MAKRDVPIAGAHGKIDAVTIAALLNESVLDLVEGQRLRLSKPLDVVVLRQNDTGLLGIFEFSAGAEVTRLRTEKKANYQTYHITNMDASLQIVLKKEGFHAYEPDDALYYISHALTQAASQPLYRVDASTHPRWHGPDYTK